MRPPLSQTDIDRMMRGDGSSDPKRAARRLDVQVYDFTRPHRVSADRLRALEAMSGRLVKSLEGWMMGRVRGLVDLRLQSVEQISFGEYILSLPANCNSFVVDVKDKDDTDNLGEQGVIDIGRELAFYLVDRLFGGGAEATILDRTLTPIERLAVRVVAERLMALVADIWEDHVELELSLAGFESVPEVIQAATRESPVLVTNIEANFSNLTSLISVCLPLSALEKFFVMGASANQAAATRRESQTNRAVAEKALRATSVEVAARLPELRLSMRDIAALRAGSLLSTGIPVDSQVDVFVGGQARFKSAAGRVGRKLAVRVLEPIRNVNSDLLENAQ